MKRAYRPIQIMDLPGKMETVDNNHLYIWGPPFRTYDIYEWEALKDEQDAYQAFVQSRGRDRIRVETFLPISLRIESIVKTAYPYRDALFWIPAHVSDELREELLAYADWSYQAGRSHIFVRQRPDRNTGRVYCALNHIDLEWEQPSLRKQHDLIRAIAVSILEARDRISQYGPQERTELDIVMRNVFDRTRWAEHGATI